MSVIDIVVDGLRRHADRVDEVAAEIYHARSVAGQVSMQSEAYGRLCSPILTPVLGTLEGGGIAAMTAAAWGVEGTSGALRVMASSLDLVDQIAAGRVAGAGR
ncbi:MAG TPA: type VII secretion target [Pilimelia sp.]|nr:type VII secretion target [Pilimelia sp.]